MQNYFERRAGTDRRAVKLFTSSGIGIDSAWQEPYPGAMFGDGETTYDPYDPYWEPIKGQDDD